MVGRVHAVFSCRFCPSPHIRRSDEQPRNTARGRGRALVCGPAALSTPVRWRGYPWSVRRPCRCCAAHMPAGKHRASGPLLRRRHHGPGRGGAGGDRCDAAVGAERRLCAVLCFPPPPRGCVLCCAIACRRFPKSCGCMLALVGLRMCTGLSVFLPAWVRVRWHAPGESACTCFCVASGGAGKGMRAGLKLGEGGLTMFINMRKTEQLAQFDHTWRTNGFRSAPSPSPIPNQSFLLCPCGVDCVSRRPKRGGAVA